MILMAMNICGILTVITINVTFKYQKINNGDLYELHHEKRYVHAQL